MVHESKFQIKTFTKNVLLCETQQQNYLEEDQNEFSLRESY